MTKKILITGIAGFIGSHIVDEYNDHKGDLYGIDNFSTGRKENLEKNINRIEQIFDNDIRSREVIFRIFNLVKPDIVIHLAAQPSLLTSMENPRLDVTTNVMGTLHLIEAAKLFEVKHFIFASTSAVCEAPVQEPYAPMLFVFLPKSVYGISKYASEMYIRTLFGENHTIFRFANIYGERQVPLGKNQLIPQAIKHILYDDELVIRSDGSHTRDFTYVKDVARAIVKAASDKVYGTYNLASGKPSSVKEILEKLKELSGWGGAWEYGENTFDERKRADMNNRSFIQAFGGFKFTPTDTGLKQTIDWWRANG